MKSHCTQILRSRQNPWCIEITPLKKLAVESDAVPGCRYFGFSLRDALGLVDCSPSDAYRTIQTSPGPEIFALVHISYHERLNFVNYNQSGLPFLGNISKLVTSSNLVLLSRRWAHEDGPIMQFSVLGQKLFVLSSERAAQDFFVKRGARCSDRRPPFVAQQLTEASLLSMADQNGEFLGP